MSDEIERLKAETDRLRERAKSLRQGRWSDGPDDALMMEHAAERIAALESENAKLRKLARGLNWCTENAKVPSAECKRCPLRDTEDGELSCEKLMRELGIEMK